MSDFSFDDDEKIYLMLFTLKILIVNKVTKE